MSVNSCADEYFCTMQIEDKRNSRTRDKKQLKAKDPISVTYKPFSISVEYYVTNKDKHVRK